MLYATGKKAAGLAGWQLFSFKDWKDPEGTTDTRAQPSEFKFVQGK